MKISLIAFDDFTDIDIFFLWDLLNRVQHPAWRVRILGTKDEHYSISGLKLEPHGHIKEANDSDVVLFGSGKGVRPLLNNQDYLSCFHLNPQKQWIGSMCSGSLLLGALGLLKGLDATTYYTSKDLLAQYGAFFVNKPFVVNGRIATAAGCLAAIDLAYWVISSVLDDKAAEMVVNSVLPNNTSVESLSFLSLHGNKL